MAPEGVLKGNAKRKPGRLELALGHMTTAALERRDEQFLQATQGVLCAAICDLVQAGLDSKGRALVASLEDKLAGVTWYHFLAKEARLKQSRGRR